MCSAIVALAVLQRQAFVRVTDWIFPGRGGGVMGYTVFSRAPAKARIDAGSPHSWRSIFCDWGEEKGSVAPQTLETALAHCLGAVESAYRRETAIPARAVAMQKYFGWRVGRPTLFRSRRGRYDDGGRRRR
jgi:integrase